MTREITVESSARLHIGFRNLSPALDPLFGSIGVAITPPDVSVTASPDDAVQVDHDRARAITAAVVSACDLPGARVDVDAAFPSHVGLGSGTQLTLATYAAISHAYDRTPKVREIAPILGRGRRSGIGIATFENGGFVVDDGHPREAVLGARGERDAWRVPSVATRCDLPTDWRFVLVLPDAPRGKHGRSERHSILGAIARASRSNADAIARVLDEQVLPGISDNDIARFGKGITTIDRRNGEWFAAEQGARHRPPADMLVRSLAQHGAVYGTGQSSWGPLVYALTHTDDADEVLTFAEDALETTGQTGHVWIGTPRNTGATTHESDECMSEIDRAPTGGTIR